MTYEVRGSVILVNKSILDLVKMQDTCEPLVKSEMHDFSLMAGKLKGC